MRHKILITMIAIFFFLAVPLWAQPNNYRKADYALRLVYKQVTGISLKDAIDSLIAEQPDSLYDSTSQVDETAPPKRSCPPLKSSNPNLIHVPNDSVTRPVYTRHFDIFPGKNGTHLVPVMMGFIGDLGKIRPLASGNIDAYSKTVFGFTLVLEELPKLCQMKGVQYIEIQPQPTLE